MTTADWALVISIVSALVSLASFVWNVWSKFIYPKPKLSVSFNFMTVMQPGSRDHDTHILTLQATNMGPADVTLYSAITLGKRLAWWRRRRQFGLLNPLDNYPASLDYTRGPFSGGLPKKVAVGESFSSYFVPDHEELAKGEIVKIGFHDTFGRNHWCPRGDVKRALPSIRAECDKVGKKYR